MEDLHIWVSHITGSFYLLHCKLMRVWAQKNFDGIRRVVRRFGIIPPSVLVFILILIKFL